MRNARRAGPAAAIRPTSRTKAAIAGSINVSPLSLAYVHAGLGERDAAFAKLEQAYDQRSPTLVGIKIDRLLDPLREDPRFG